MAGVFENSSTRPRTIATVLLVIGVVFLLMAAPLISYGVSRPSTVENEMLPFILLLCGLLIGAVGLGMVIIGARVTRRYPGR